MRQINDKIVQRLVFAFLIFSTTFNVIAGQSRTPCEVGDAGERSIKYSLGHVERVPETDTEPSGLLVNVAVKPDLLTKDSLIVLASSLRRRFCNEQRLTVSIFDRKDVATRFRPEFKEARDALRGVYVLNRVTGEEYISFVPIPDYFGNPQAREQINLKNREAGLQSFDSVCPWLGSTLIRSRGCGEKATARGVVKLGRAFDSVVGVD